MKRIEMSAMAQTKCMEMEQVVAMKSGNKNPDYYKSLKEFKMWQVMVGILNSMESEEVHINESLEGYFKELIAGGKKGTTVVVHEGEKLMDLLQMYEGVKDVYNKIKKACESQGLKIELGEIVKA